MHVCARVGFVMGKSSSQRVCDSEITFRDSLFDR